MNFNLIFELPCTYAGDIETIKSNSGKSYTIRKCSFSDGLRDIKGAVLFADDNGFLPELNEGNIYRVKITRFYDKESKTEKEFFKILKEC